MAGMGVMQVCGKGGEGGGRLQKADNGGELLPFFCWSPCGGVGGTPCVCSRPRGLKSASRRATIGPRAPLRGREMRMHLSHRGEMPAYRPVSSVRGLMMVAAPK